MKLLISIFLVLLSGLLMALAHPFRYQNWALEASWLNLVFGSLGLLLFIPLSLRPQQMRWRFLLGFLGGLAFFSGIFYWVTYALYHFGNINIFISVLAMLLLSAYCALFMGCWSLISGSEIIKNRTPLLKMLCWASLWTSLEALRQWIFTGISWGEMGFSFSFLPLVARTASVWGVHGLTFIWIFLIGLILHIKGFWDRSLNPRQVSLTIGALLMIGVLSLWLYPKDESETIKVGLVQPNVSQEIKWDPTRAEEHFKILLDLTDTGVRHGAELLVWPETALPYSLSGTQRELPFLSSVPLLFGAVVREGAINRNAAVLTQGGQILQKFDKIHLVPFGEYVPFKEWLSFGKLVQNAGDFLPGREEQNLIDIPGTQALIGPLICYEDIFSRSSVAHAKKGAQLLVNLTNDAWYGPTSAQSQHASHAAMQVYQTGLPMIRSTNNGVSSFITPFSRTDLKTFSRGVDVQTLPFSKTPRQTFFVWTYPLMEWLFFAIFLTALLWKNRSRTKRIFFRKSKIY